jgi:hypothetical protein
MTSNQPPPPPPSSGQFPMYPPGPYGPGGGAQPAPPVLHETQASPTYWPPPGQQPDPSLLPAPPPTRRKTSATRKALRILLGLVFVPLGLITAIGIAAAVFAGPKPVRAPAVVPESGVITQPGTLSALDLQPGDCYNTKLPPVKPGETQMIATVEAVPCTQPHTDQVVTTITYSAADPFPGTSTARAEQDCSAAFEQKLDPAAFNQESLSMATLSPPNESEWRRSPVVACTLQSNEPVDRSFVR